MSWRAAKSLNVLLSEIVAQFPDRDHASDGAIGNQEHAARKSDHNPDSNGVVRARDYDEDLDGAGKASGQAKMAVIAEHIRRMGEYGDHRLVGGTANGYVIYEKRIAGAGKGWQWRTYTGTNAHEHHMHVSVCANPAGYDDTAPWHIRDLFHNNPAPAAHQEDDDMGYLVTNEDNGYVFAIAGNTRRRVSGPNKDPNRVQELKNLGWRDAGKVSTGHLVETTVAAAKDDE